jgi:AraC-like DNA-binding protein
MFCFSCLILIYVAYWNRLVIKPAFIGLNQLYWPFLYAIPPLFYLYLNALTERHRYKRLHFILPIIILASWLPFYFMPSDQKAEYLKRFFADKTFYYRLASFLNWFVILYLSVYLFLSVKTVFDYKKGIDKKLLNRNLFNWFKTLLWAFGVFVLGHFFYYVLVSRLGFPVEWDYGISLVMCSMIFIIGYKSYASPELFAERAKLEIHNKKKEVKLVSDVKSKLIIDQLQLLMETKKPYLNDQLKLTDLANRLEVSTHRLSYIMNKKLQTTFNDYINGHRIDYAKQLLKSTENRYMKVSDIAYQSGFNSRTSFYNTFKKFADQTPTAYRANFLGSQTPL